MKDHIAIHLLDGAAAITQKLHKKLRQLSNRGEATEEDLADAADACESIAKIYERHGLRPLDIDGQKERRRKKGGAA